VSTSRLGKEAGAPDDPEYLKRYKEMKAIQQVAISIRRVWQGADRGANLYS